jgi:hypothetical protein
MDDAINHLHDATLVSIQLHWGDRTCELSFAGAPSIPGPFSLVFAGVTELHVPSTMPWAPSVSVLEAAFSGGVATIAMQSGDTVTLVSPNYSFKQTPLRGAA